MNYYEKQITEKDKKEIREFCNIFNLRVVFESYNYADIPKNKIYINEKYPLSIAWSAIFHELQHFICYREGKFLKYHNMHKNYNKSWFKKYIRRMGLKIEIYVDIKAEELMNIYLPDIPYEQAYRTRESQLSYKEWIKESFQ